MSAEEILKMSTELSRVEMNDLSEGDYLNLFITLRIFLKNVAIAFTKNELFHLQQPHIVEDMRNTHKAFHERGVCDIVMDYADTDGIAEIRDLCDDVDKRMVDINPEIFSFLNGALDGIFNFRDDPSIDDGFSVFLDSRSYSELDGFPLRPFEVVNRMIYLINQIPYAFFKAVIEYIEANETDDEPDEESDEESDEAAQPQVASLVSSRDEVRCEASSVGNVVRRCSQHHHLSEEEIEEAVRNGARRILLCGYDCDCEVDCDCKSND